MPLPVVQQLILIVGFGFVAHLLAYWLRLPSIFFLLSFGLLLGPGAGLIFPDQLLGPILKPLVSLSVALILFEGGLLLSFRELRGLGTLVLRFLLMGSAITFGLCLLFLHFVLGFPAREASILSALLVVTGPTVVIPLLEQIRAGARFSAVARWEGILNDPLGALLAVGLYETWFGHLRFFPPNPEVWLRAIVLPILLGILFGVALHFLLRGAVLTEAMENFLAVTAVLLGFGLADLLFPEAGLVTATVMGMTLRNLPGVDLQPLLEFKETLRLFLLSILFLLLSARVELRALREYWWTGLLLLLFLLAVVRPAAVFLSSFFSDLRLQEKLLLCTLAPRGIVTVGVGSLLAMDLPRQGNAAEAFYAYVVLIPLGTILVASLSAVPLARFLRLAGRGARNVLILGANPVGLRFGELFRKGGIPVLLVDLNPRNVHNAQNLGLRAVQANILSPYLHEQLDLENVGLFLALTPNNLLNTLAVQRFRALLGRHAAFLPKPEGERAALPLPLRTNVFPSELTFSALERAVEEDRLSAPSAPTDQAVPLFSLPAEGPPKPLPKAGEPAIYYLPAPPAGPPADRR